MAKNTQVKVDLKAWNRLLKAVESKDLAARVGILGASVKKKHKPAKPLTRAERKALGLKRGKKRKPRAPIDRAKLPSMISIAATHEFGDVKRKIPKRSFIRAGVRANVKAMRKLCMRLARNIASGKIDMRQAHHLLGNWGAAQIKNYAKLSAHIAPELKPSTIKKRIRPSTRPLVDTGQLINAVNYDVSRDLKKEII